MRVEKCAFLPHNCIFTPLIFAFRRSKKLPSKPLFLLSSSLFPLLLAAKFLPTPFCLCCPKILDFQMGRFPKALNINKIQ